ncbi:MAG: histidine kinase dimerization/phospho-acceptor domain-containing protein [Brevundimonas sp.]
MHRWAGGSGQRLLIIIGGTLLMPAILLLAWALVLGLMRAQSSIELRALERARSLLAAADGRLAVDRGALLTFATADTLAQRDWPLAGERARRIIAVNRGWRAVQVVEDRTGLAVVDTRHDGPSHPMAAMAGSPLRVVREGDGCPCVILRQPIPAAPGYSLIALIDPREYQSILLAHVQADATTALVDPDGAFIARSLNFAERVGTPATVYVRRAVAKGGEGIYEGRTYEGLENYTAYATSNASGWSAHVAVNRKLIDSPRFWLFIVLVGGALATLLAGGGVIAYAFVDMAVRRRSEEEMRRLQKSEAIGQFTSGVAHDFNNLLTVVIANLERIRAAGAGPDVTRRAGMALQAAQRGARLSNQLLSFAREGGAELEDVDVNVLLDEIGTASAVDRRRGEPRHRRGAVRRDGPGQSRPA